MSEPAKNVAGVAHKVKDLPSAEFLHECFRYDPESGELFWKERPEHHFKNRFAMLAWNPKFAGKKSGCVTQLKKPHGNFYTIVNIGGHKSCLTHRIIYVMHFGRIPDGMQVDHRDGNTLNNRIDNLRVATNQQNNFNKGEYSKRRTRKEGLPKGVQRCGGKKFYARIKVSYKMINLGGFQTPEEAERAYIAAYQFYAKEFAKEGDCADFTQSPFN